jgi:hypothetical protein
MLTGKKPKLSQNEKDKKRMEINEERDQLE